MHLPGSASEPRTIRAAVLTPMVRSSRQEDPRRSNWSGARPSQMTSGIWYLIEDNRQDLIAASDWWIGIGCLIAWVVVFLPTARPHGTEFDLRRRLRHRLPRGG